MEDLEARVAALEHLVNDVLIGGLKKANDEYIDEDNYSKFQDNYGAMLEPYVKPMKAICGEDYDLSRDLYDFAKTQDGYGTEGFDEKAIIDDAIENIKAKMAAIKGVAPEDVEVKVEADVADTEKEDVKDETADAENEDEKDVPSVKELSELYDKAYSK